MKQLNTMTEMPANATEEPQITIYGPEICPECDKVIGFLERNKIAYQKIEIHAGTPDYDFVTNDLGYKVAPVIVLKVDGRRVHWGTARMDMLMALRKLVLNIRAKNETTEVAD